MTNLYDTIGAGYGELRRPDARIAAAIEWALDGAATVMNVGAGAGSYEPRGSAVLAVEPSRTMLRQRADDAAPAVQASADSLPLGNRSFDAALAVLTVHHWPDAVAGLREMARVARRVVVLTWDPQTAGFWLVSDYFPEILEIDQRIFPGLATFESALGPVRVEPVPIPHDCTDGFLGAWWRRPEAYLHESVRAAISTFAKLDEDVVRTGIERLRNDLADGRWLDRCGDLTRRTELDLGYRLVLSEDTGA